VAEKDHLEVRMGVLGLPIDRDNFLIPGEMIIFA